MTVVEQWLHENNVVDYHLADDWDGQGYGTVRCPYPSCYSRPSTLYTHKTPMNLSCTIWKDDMVWFADCAVYSGYIFEVTQHIY